MQHYNHTELPMFFKHETRRAGQMLQFELDRDCWASLPSAK